MYLIHKQRAGQFPMAHHKLIPLHVNDHMINVGPSMDATQLEPTEVRRQILQ